MKYRLGMKYLSRILIGAMVSVMFCCTTTNASINAGDDIYVAIDGNDDNNGTVDKPLRTIQEGIDRLKPGLNLFIKGGIYHENLFLDIKGSEFLKINISNYNNELVIIDGDSSNSDEDIFYIENPSYIRIEGLEIINNSGSDNATGIFVEGYGTEISIVNNVIHDIKASEDGHGIAIYGTNGNKAIEKVNISGNKVYNCELGTSEAIVVNGNIKGFSINNNIVHDNNNIGIDCIGYEGNAPKNDQARNGLVYNNEVYNISTLKNEAYKELSAGGIYVDGGKDIRIYNNKVYNCDIGIEVASENSGKVTSGVFVYDNYIVNNNLYGICLGGESEENGIARNNNIEFNTLYNNDTSIVFQNSEENTIVNNLIISDSVLVEGKKNLNTLDNNWWYSNLDNRDGFDIFKEVSFINSSDVELELLQGFNGYGARQFDDIDYLTTLIDKGIIKGNGIDYNLEGSLTREELVTILYRLTNYNESVAIGDYNVEHFSDVKSNHWAFNYVEYAYEHNITKGIGNNEFGLGDDVTYQQAVTFLNRVTGNDGTYTRAVEISDYLGIESELGKRDSTLKRKYVFELIYKTIIVMENN